MDTGAPSPAEERLAAAYTALLRRVSACAQAVGTVTGGTWRPRPVNSPEPQLTWKASRR
ncbi:hypothetical protein [Streptomyces caniscabiei]|uniref:hypothetical protein n=1 Tax=Streptomyces caniscabiei TaxID=2746961 RepID=UPI0038F7C0CE